MVITGAPDLSWIFRNIADDAHTHVQPLRAAAAACRTYAAKIENVPGDCDTIIATGLANWDGPAKDAFLLSWAINFSGTPNDGYSPASFSQLSNEAMAHGAPLQPILPALHSQILDTADQLEDLASKIEQYVIACKTAQVIDLGLAVLSVVLFILTIEIGGEGGLVAGLFSYLGVDAAATYLAGQLVAWGLGWVVSIAAPIVTNVVMPALELAFISGMINLVSQEVTNALVWDPYRQSIGEPPAGVNWNEVVDAALIGGMSGAVMGGVGGIAGALLKPVMQDASPILRQVITRSLGAVLGGVGDIPVQLTHVFDPNHPRGWDWGEFGSSIGVGALMGGRIGDLFTQRPTLIIDNPDGGTLFMAPEKGLKVDLNSTDLSVIDPTTGRPVSADRWAFNVIDPATGRIIGHALPGTSNLDDPFLRVVYNDGTVDNYALNGSTVHMFTSEKVGLVDGPTTSAKPPDGVPLNTKYDKHVAYSVEGGKARPLFQTEALGDKKIAVSAFDGQGDPHLVEVHEKLTDEIEVQVVDSSLGGPDVVTTIELPKDSWVVYDQNGSVVAATRPMNKVSFDPSPSGPGGVRPSRVDRNSTELYMAGSDRQLRRLGFIRKNPISKKFDFYGDKWRPGDSEGLFTFTGSGFEGMSLRQFPDGLGTTTIAVGETQRFAYDLTGKVEPTFPAPAPKETTGTAAPHSAGRTVDAKEPQQEEQRTLLVASVPGEIPHSGDEILSSETPAPTSSEPPVANVVQDPVKVASARSEPASTSRLVTPASGEPLKLALPKATGESQTAVTTNDALQTLRRHARTLLQELSDRPPSEGYDLRKALESLRDLVGDLDGHPRKDGLLEALGMMLDDRWGLRNGLNTDPLIKDELFLPLLRQLADLAPGPHVPRLPDPQGFRFDASASSGSESADGGLVPEQEEPAAVSPPSTPKPELPAHQRVEAMVPGLWEEIDPSSKTVGPWMFKDYGPYRNDDTVSMTKLLRTYGVAPGDQVLANFAIHIQVEPVSTTPAAASGDVEVLKDLHGSPPAPEIVRPRHPDASRFVYPYDGLIHPAVENEDVPAESGVKAPAGDHVPTLLAEMFVAGDDLGIVEDEVRNLLPWARAYTVAFGKEVLISLRPEPGGTRILVSHSTIGENPANLDVAGLVKGYGRRILVSSVRTLDTDEAFHLEAPGGRVRPFDVRPTPERLIPYAGMRDGPGREAELDQIGEALQEWHEHGLGELKAGQLDAILTYIDSLLTEADAIAQFKGGELRPIAQRFTKVATSLWDLLYRADAFGSVEAFTPRAGTKAYNRILTARKLVRAELGNYRTRVVARVPLRSRDLPELDEEERDRLDRFLRRATLHYRMEFGYQLAIDLDAQPGEPIWYVVVVRGGSARIGASSVFAHGHPQFDKTEASLIRRPSGLETGTEGDIGDLRNSPYTTGQIVPGDRTRHLVTYHRDRVYDIDRDGTSIRIPDLVGPVRDAVETLMLWKDISAWLPLIDALRDPRRPASWSPDPVTVQRLRSRLDHVRDDRLEPDEAALVNGKRRLLGEQAKAALDRLVSGSKAGPDDRTLINELLNYLRGLARRQQVKARMAQGEVSAHFPSYDPRNPAARRSVEPYRAGGGPPTPHKPEPSAWMSPADAKRWWDELTPAQQDDMARIFVGVHGVSPTAATFKGTRFLSDPGAAGPWYMLRLSRPAHQQYFEPGNAALTHIAKIIVGGESPVQDAVDETRPITEVGSGPGGGGRSSITAFLEELKTLPDEDFIARVREFLASLGGSPGDAKQRETVQRIEEFLGLIGEDSAARRVAWDALQQLVDPSSGLPPDLRAQHGLGDRWKPASDLDKRSEDLARERERLRGEEQALTEGVHTLQQEIDQEFADKSAAIHASAEAMLGRIDEIKTKNEDLAAARFARIEAEFRATMEAITQQSVQSVPEVPVDESANGPVLDPRLTPEELLRQLDQIRTELNQAMQAENAESGPQAAEQEKAVEGSSETVKPPARNELQQNLSARLVEGGAHVVPSAASPPVVPGARWLPADASLEALEDALTEQQQRLAALDESEAVFDERNAPLRSIVTALDLFRRISAARDRHLANARQHLDSYDAQALSMPTRRGLDYQDSMRLRQSLLDRWAENAAHDIEEVEFLERVVAWGKRKGRITPEQQAQVDTLFEDFPELDDLPASIVNGLPTGLRGRLFDIRQFVVDAIKVHEYLTRRGLGPLLDSGIDGLHTAHRERLKALDQHILDTRAGIAAQNEALRAARQVHNPVQVAAATAARQALRADLDEALGERRRLDRLVAFYLNEHPERLGAEVAVTDDRVRELRRLLEAAMRTGDTTAVASLSESLGRAIDHLQRLSAQYAIYDLRTRLAQVMEVVRQARTAGDAGRLRTAKKQAHRLRAAVRTLQAVPEAVRAARSLLSELAEIDVALADAEQTANDKVAAAGVDVARVRRIRNAYANREKALENRRTRLTAAFEDHLRTLQGNGYLQHLLDAALAGDREAAATLLDHERLLRWIEHRRALAAGRTVRPKAEKPHELPIDTRDPVVQQVFRTSQKAIPKMAKYAFYERRREEAMGYEPTVHSLDMRLQEPHPSKAARLGRKMERLRKRIPDLSAVHSYGRYVIEQEDDQRPGVQAVRERVSEAAAPDPLWSADSVDVVVRHIEDGLGPAQRARADFAAERTRRNSYVSALNEVVDAMRAVERLRLAGAAETEVRSQYERLVTARLGLRGWTVVGSEALPIRQSLDGRELPPVPSRADDDPRTWVDEIEEIREIPVNVPFALHHTHRDVFKDGKPLDWVGGDLPIESTIESQKYVVVMKDGAEYEVTEFVHQTLVIRSGSLLEGGLAMARIGGGLTTPLSAFSWAPKHAVGFGPFTLLFQLPFGLNTDLQYIPELRRDFFVYEHVGRKTVKVKRLTDHGDPRKSWKIHTPATGIKLVDDTLKTVQFYVKWGLQAQIVPMVVVKFGDPSTTDGNQLVDLASFGAVGAGQVTGEIAYFRDAATGAFIRMDWTAGVEFLYGLFGGMPDHYGATRLLPDVSPFMNWRPTPSTVPWNRVWTLDIKPLIQHVRDAVLLKVPGLSTVIQRRLDAVNRLQYVGVAGQWAKDRRAYLLLEALKGHDRPSDDEGPQLLVPPSRGPRPKKPTGGPALRSPSGGDLLLPLDPPPTPVQTSRTRPVAGAASKAVEPGPKRAPAPTPPPPSDVPPAVAQLLQVEAKNQAEQARRRVEDALRGGDLVQNAADEILALVKEVESFAALPSDQGLRGIHVTAHADAVRALRHRIGELPPAPGTTGVLRTTPLAPVEDPNGQDGGKLR
ncbi:hypothetical protein GCM10023191_041350 [Actinoallomurus oryzae]|uniref:Uncharacterized protein n=1 Tax=Actinoallomurus oryzae TaxID=502180 RepID=A0ABP8Q418_9ACTN